MISASKSTLSLNNIKILRPKVTKILQIWLRSFVNFHPDLDKSTILWVGPFKEKNQAK